jgi:hypothetical protein
MRFTSLSRRIAIFAALFLFGIAVWSFRPVSRAYAQSVTPTGTYSFLSETQITNGMASLDVPAIGVVTFAGGQLTGTMQERSNAGLVERSLKGTYTIESSGMGRMTLCYDAPVATEEGASGTETMTRSYVFAASDGALVVEALRSDAGPIERLTLHRQ